MIIRSRTKGKGDSMSMEQLMDFMNEKQRDPRLNEILFPKYSEKRCMEIINDYELEEKNKTASTKIRFLFPIHPYFFELPIDHCKTSVPREIIQGWLHPLPHVGRERPRVFGQARGVDGHGSTALSLLHKFESQHLSERTSSWREKQRRDVPANAPRGMQVLSSFEFLHSQ